MLVGGGALRECNPAGGDTGSMGVMNFSSQLNCGATCGSHCRQSNQSIQRTQPRHLISQKIKCFLPELLSSARHQPKTTSCSAPDTDPAHDC